MTRRGSRTVAVLFNVSLIAATMSMVAAFVSGDMAFFIGIVLGVGASLVLDDMKRHNEAEKRFMLNDILDKVFSHCVEMDTEEGEGVTLEITSGEYTVDLEFTLRYDTRTVCSGVERGGEWETWEEKYNYEVRFTRVDMMRDGEPVDHEVAHILTGKNVKKNY